MNCPVRSTSLKYLRDKGILEKENIVKKEISNDTLHYMVQALNDQAAIKYHIEPKLFEIEQDKGIRKVDLNRELEFAVDNFEEDSTLGTSYEDLFEKDTNDFNDDIFNEDNLQNKKRDIPDSIKKKYDHYVKFIGIFREMSSTEMARTFPNPVAKHKINISSEDLLASPHIDNLVAELAATMDYLRDIDNGDVEDNRTTIVRKIKDLKTELASTPIIKGKTKEKTDTSEGLEELMGNSIWDIVEKYSQEREVDEDIKDRYNSYVENLNNFLEDFKESGTDDLFPSDGIGLPFKYWEIGMNPYLVNITAELLASIDLLNEYISEGNKLKSKELTSRVTALREELSKIPLLNNNKRKGPTHVSDNLASSGGGSTANKDLKLDHISKLKDLAAPLLEQKLNEKADLENAIKDRRAIINLLGNHKTKALEEVKELRKRLNEVEKQIRELEKYSSRDFLNIIHADLDSIANTFNNENSQLEILKAKKTLEFYGLLIEGIDLNNDEKGSLREVYNDNPEIFSEFGDLVAKYSDLQHKYPQLVMEAVKNILIDNKDVVETLENAGFSLEDNLENVNDITWFDKWVLGVKSSNANESVIPQFVQKSFSETSLKYQSVASVFIGNLDEVEKRTGIKNPDWIYNKDKFGYKDGYIRSVYNQDYFDFRNDIYRISMNKSQKPHQKSARINALMKNKKVGILDFTADPRVRDLYKNDRDFKEFFEEDKNAALKVKEYKEILGEFEYNKMIDQVLENLEALLDRRNRLLLEHNLTEEDYKNKTDKYKDYRKALGFSNIFSLAQASRRVDPNKIHSNYFVQTEDARNFRAFANVPVIPLKSDSELLDKDFRNLLSDSNKREYYEAVYSLAEFINTSYRTKTFGYMSYPKMKKTFLEQTHENIDSIKSGEAAKGMKGILADVFSSWKGMFYEDGRRENVTQKGIKSNFYDAYHKEKSERIAVLELSHKATEEDVERITRELNEQYSDDLSTNLKALAQLAAEHNARVETADLADLMLQAQRQLREKDSKGEDKKELVNSLVRFENYIKSIILNHNTKMEQAPDITTKNIADIFAVYGVDTADKKTLADKLFKNISKGEEQLIEDLRDVLSLLGSDREGFISHYKDKFCEVTAGPGGEPKFSPTKTYQYKGKTLASYGGDGYGYGGQEISEKEFFDLLEGHLKERIKNVGIPLNGVGIIEGFLKVASIKSLGLNPSSGVFNRVEGMNSAYAMDATGEYWTPGNLLAAKSMLGWINFMKILPERLTKDMKGKINQIRIFEQFIDRTPGLFQDRKDVFTKNNADDKLSVDIFAWSVTWTEFKNQGSIVLAMMMDYQVENSKGEKVPMVDPVTGEFNVFELDSNGVLKTKEGFEKYNDFSYFSDIVTKANVAISRSQGDYSDNEKLLYTNNIFGKVIGFMMRWLPEHLNQRWGVRGEYQVDLYTRKKAQDGRYITAFKGNKINMLASLAGLTGLSYGILGLFAGAGVGLLGAAIATYQLRKAVNKDTVARETNYLLEFAQHAANIALEFINYPSYLLSSIPGMKNLRIGENSKIRQWTTKNTMTKEEQGSLRSMARELAMGLHFLGAKMTIMFIYGAMGGGDDDKLSKRRLRYNYLQNQLTRAITSLNVYADPPAFLSERLGTDGYAGFRIFKDTATLLYHIASFNSEEVYNDIYKVLPVPNIAERTTRSMFEDDVLPFYENKREYPEAPSFDKIPNPLKWTTEMKREVLGGESYYKSEYTKIRKELSSRMVNQIAEENPDLSEEEVAKRAKKAVNSTYGTKRKSQTYQEVFEALKERIEEE